MKKLTKEERYIDLLKIYIILSTIWFFVRIPLIYRSLSNILQLFKYNNFDKLSSKLSIYNKHFGDIAYIIGYGILSIDFIVMLILKSNNGYGIKDKIDTSFFRMFGHIIIILAVIWSIYYYGITTDSLTQFLIRLTLIYMFITSNYSHKPIFDISFNNKQILHRDIYIIVFIAIALIYIYKFFNEPIYKYGMYMIITIYLSFNIFWSYHADHID